MLLLATASPAAAQQVLFDKPVRAGDLVMFRDVHDEKAYYYAPTRPRLATDPNGLPQFSFFRWVENVRSGAKDPEAREGEGGGIIHALVTFGVSRDLLTAAERDLQRQMPGAKIAGPIVPKSGVFTLVSSMKDPKDPNNKFSTQVLGVGNAPVLDGDKAAVSITLTKLGAKVLWEQFQTPTPDISFSFEMTINGFLGPIRALIEANLDEIVKHDSFAAGIAGNFFGAEIKGTFDELRRTNVIKVTQVGEDAKFNEIIKSAYDKLVELLFEKGSPAAAAGAGAGAPEAGAAGGESWLTRATTQLGAARTRSDEVRTQNNEIAKRNAERQAKREAATAAEKHASNLEAQLRAAETAGSPPAASPPRVEARRPDRPVTSPQPERAAAPAEPVPATAGGTETTPAQPAPPEQPAPTAVAQPVPATADGTQATPAPSAAPAEPMPTAAPAPEQPAAAAPPPAPPAAPAPEQPAAAAPPPQPAPAITPAPPDPAAQARIAQLRATAEAARLDALARRQEATRAGPDESLKDMPAEPGFAVMGTYQLKRSRTTGIYRIDLNKHTAETRVFRFDENIGDLRPLFKSGHFRQVNLDDPLYKQREIVAILDGMNAEDFGQYINFVSLRLRKTHEGGDLTDDEIRIDRKTFNQEGANFKMLYGWKGDNNRRRWMDYEYQTLWSFFGGHTMEMPWAKASAGAIPLSPPLQRRSVELQGDPKLLAQQGVRSVSVKIFYRAAQDAPEQVKQLTLNAAAPNFVGRIEFVGPRNLVDYDFEIAWRLTGNREVTSGRQKTSSTILYLDDLPKTAGSQ
jgi:hypothetical protein